MARFRAGPSSADVISCKASWQLACQVQPVQPIPGIEVTVICDGRSKDAGVTQAGGFKVDCAGAPTAVALGLRMFGLAPQTVNVTDRAGTDKVYVFEFDPGDLGKKKFVVHRLQIGTDGSLLMVYDGAPIQELRGHRFQYMRER
jgi:hypothetical protein